MILCAGEILADMIGSVRDGGFVYERKAGGAPFNVACAAKRFGARVCFAGSVGDDLIGAFLEEFAKRRELDGLILKRDRERNTTLAFVQLDEKGERSFCFYRKNTADYHLPEIGDPLLREADIVHIGSLMLSEDAGREYAEKLAVRAHAFGKTVSFDVNFRTDIFRDTESALTIYRRIIRHADIVKFSEDEVEIFGEKYLETLSDKLVCVTLGGAGSEWRRGGKGEKVATIPVTPVDTTGAGDAFYAGFLSRLDSVKKEEWTDGFLSDALLFGNLCGALNTQGKGAIDSLPSLEQVKACFAEYKAKR